MNSEQVRETLEHDLPWRDQLRLIAAAIVGPTAAEDVLQQVHLEAWTGFAVAGWEVNDEQHLRRWLRRMTRRRAQDAKLKSERTRKGIASMIDHETYLDRQQELNSGVWIERRAILNDLVSKLPKRQHLAWVLVVREGYTEREAGEIMGISQQSVNRLVTKANNALLGT